MSSAVLSRPQKPKLRRAQALALGNGTALKISKELISQKLAGQELLVRDILHDPATANAIARFIDKLPSAESIEVVRLLEAQAAKLYWHARGLTYRFAGRERMSAAYLSLQTLRILHS